MDARLSDWNGIVRARDGNKAFSCSVVRGRSFIKVPAGALDTILKGSSAALFKADEPAGKECATPATDEMHPGRAVVVMEDKAGCCH